MDEFEFIELGDRGSVIFDGDAAQFAEGYGIEKAEGGRAVGEDEAFAVLGEPPAFAGVGDSAEQAKAEAVVDQRDVVLPGELHQSAAPVGEAFGEVLGGHVVELQDAAGFEVLHAQGGLAVEAGALIKVAIEKDESLGIGLPVVGVGVNDAVGVGGAGRRDGQDAEGQQENGAAATPQARGEDLQAHCPPWKRPNARASMNDMNSMPAPSVSTCQLLSRLKLPTRQMSR